MKKYEFYHETYYASSEEEKSYYAPGEHDHEAYYGRIHGETYEDPNGQINEALAFRRNEGWEIVGYRYIAKTGGIRIFLRREIMI